MAAKTEISWSDATWNIITGCTVLSPGCQRCYAMRLAGEDPKIRDHPSRVGLTTMTKAGAVWNGQVRFNDAWLGQPYHWKKPKRVFVCAHGDLFHEGVTVQMIDMVFAIMAISPQHVFQVLTKRSARMREYLSDPHTTRRIIATMQNLFLHDHYGVKISRQDYERFAMPWPLPNVWVGVSVEDQKRAAERLPDLGATPAALRWASLEPLLGPVAVREIEVERGIYLDALSGFWTGKLAELKGDVTHATLPPRLEPLDYIVLGGESGRDSRPLHPDWPRMVLNDCRSSLHTIFHFKQWGDWAPMRADLIPVPRERQGWVHVDTGRLFQAKVEADLDAIDREEQRAGRPLYGHVANAGKRKAGHMLDGVEHRDEPEWGVTT